MMKEVIEHKHFDDAKCQLKRALNEHKPGRIVGICGMPGSGKTFLRNLVMRELLGSPESWGIGLLPATEVMALLDINSNFSSKGFAARSHRAVLRPDLRALYRDATDELNEDYLASLLNAEKAWGVSRSVVSTPEHFYWQAFSDLAIDRKLKYLLVEHAAAIGRVPKDEEPRNHVWNLMSLLEKTECMGIFNLIPEGYKLWEGRPEISERMELVFIRPYDICDESELTQFSKIVVKVASRYELESDRVFTEQINEIAIATATSIRPVEKLFSKASVNAQNRGSKAIGFNDISTAFETDTHIATLWHQVRLLNTISKSATKDQLMEIHQRYLKDSD